MHPSTFPSDGGWSPLSSVLFPSGNDGSFPFALSNFLFAPSIFCFFPREQKEATSPKGGRRLRLRAAVSSASLRRPAVWQKDNPERERGKGEKDGDGIDGKGGEEGGGAPKRKTVPDTESTVKEGGISCVV